VVATRVFDNMLGSPNLAGAFAIRGYLTVTLAFAIPGLSTLMPSRGAYAEQPTGTAYQVFAAAQATWQKQQYPVAVGYDVYVETIQAGVKDERHYNCRWNSLSDLVLVNRVSSEQIANPYKPSAGVGINLLGLRGNIGGPVRGTGTYGDLIGVPDLAPTYTFGMSSFAPSNPTSPADLVEEIRNEYRDPAPEKVAQLEQEYGLKTIASIRTGPTYRVLLVGMERILGVLDYHLSLTPLRDPQRYRLRDLWINSENFQTDQVRTQGNFVDGGTSSVFWITTYQTVDGSRYLAREITEQPIHHWYDYEAVSFENIRAASGAFSGSPNGSSPIREP